MSFDQDGFLSPDITIWIEQNRGENARWFALIDAMNRIAQSRLLALKVDGDDPKGIFAAALYGRALTNFQGAIVLAERGHQPGSRTLLRNCFEDIFYLGAIQSADNYYEKFLQADSVDRTRLARALLARPESRDHLDPAHIELLQEFVASVGENLPKSSPINVAQAARDAGLSRVYDIYYRGLSNEAAHPSVMSLWRHIDKARSKFRWGPEPAQMVDTLSAACAAVSYLVSSIDDYIGEDGHKAELDEHLAEFSTLMQQIHNASGRT